METNGKFAKNDKLSFITDDMLIAGCDIGSETHYIRAIDVRGMELSSGAFEFSNTSEGFANAKAWVLALAAKNDKKQMKNEILSMWKLKPTLEYTTGWKVFGELLQFGLILGSIMVLCVISGIFAEESQTKMLPVIFTTVEGKRKDTSAKVLASFTITVLLYAGITGSAWGLCKIVYDLKGGYNLTGVVISGSMWKTVDKVPFFSYLSVLLILGMLAFLSLNAITLCISAYQDSMFGAVVATAICWAIPLLVRIFFGGLVWILVDSMPMFLIMQVNLNDIYSIWHVIAVIAVGVLAVSLTKGILHYKVKQVV